MLPEVTQVDDAPIAPTCDTPHKSILVAASRNGFAHVLRNWYTCVGKTPHQHELLQPRQRINVRMNTVP